MAIPKISLLCPDDLQAIHDTSLNILRNVGVVVHNARALELLAEAGADVDLAKTVARFSEDVVMRSIESAGKQYILYGREPGEIARFGYGDQNMISSPGQFGWFDYQDTKRRDPLLADAQAAIRLGDALENITVVGAMAVPVDVPLAVRDVVLTAELVKNTGKPSRCWPVSARSSRYVLEIYKAVAGGEEALRTRPMTEVFLEPISPLQLPDEQLDILVEFIRQGQPASLGPMAMASGTAPATLAGTLAQENAEILAGVVTIQAIAPGTPILYGGIPHIMDPRTSICAFGSPEQGLMALAMAEIGKHYGFPVYINVNLTDAKTLDVQAGMEKMGSFVLGMMSGADLFGHAGIVGTDHGGNLLWLVVDDEAASYAKRILVGFEVDENSLAESVIAEVGSGGHFLAHEHTVRHFREELWIPGQTWARNTYENWSAQDSLTMGDRALARTKHLVETHEPEPIDPELSLEIDKIVDAAYRELVG